MKIVALLPVKNEAWALPSYLSSVTKIADEVIALDDNSTDSSVDVLNQAGVTVRHYDASSEQVVNMSKRRQQLLELGRAARGTHFIWLDADETFSADFIPAARKTIAALQPGEKLALRWVHAWKDTDNYLDDSRSPFGYIWKDFVVCDDGSNFTDQFLSEPRTQGNGNIARLQQKEGVVIHWQFARWQATQYKQALYRCLEYIKGTSSARRINHTYSITLNQPDLECNLLSQDWLHDIIIPDLHPEVDSTPFKLEINKLFTKYGIRYFEQLQIWHLPELYNQFINVTDHKPQSKTYPKWLIVMNGLRHKVRRTLFGN